MKQLISGSWIYGGFQNKTIENHKILIILFHYYVDKNIYKNWQMFLLLYLIIWTLIWLNFLNGCYLEIPHLMLTSENCAGRRELDTFSHEKKRPYERYQCLPFRRIFASGQQNSKWRRKWYKMTFYGKNGPKSPHYQEMYFLIRHIYINKRFQPVAKRMRNPFFLFKSLRVDLICSQIWLKSSCGYRVLFFGDFLPLGDLF